MWHIKWGIPVVLFTLVCSSCKFGKQRTESEVVLDSVVVSISRKVDVADTLDLCLGQQSEILLNIPFIKGDGNAVTMKLNQAMSASAFPSDWFKPSGEALVNPDKMREVLTTAANTFLDSYSGQIVSYTYGKERIVFNRNGVLVLQMTLLSNPCLGEMPVFKRKFISLDLRTGDRIDWDAATENISLKDFSQALNEKKYSVGICRDTAKFATYIESISFPEFAAAEKWVDSDGLHLYFNNMDEDPFFYGELVFAEDVARPWIVDPAILRQWETP